MHTHMGLDDTPPFERRTFCHRLRRLFDPALPARGAPHPRSPEGGHRAMLLQQRPKWVCVLVNTCAPRECLVCVGKVARSIPLPLCFTDCLRAGPCVWGCAKGGTGRVAFGAPSDTAPNTPSTQQKLVSSWRTPKFPVYTQAGVHGVRQPLATPASTQSSPHHSLYVPFSCLGAFASAKPSGNIFMWAHQCGPINVARWFTLHGTQITFKIHGYNRFAKRARSAL